MMKGIKMKKLALLSMLLGLGLFVAGCTETKSPPAKPSTNNMAPPTQATPPGGETAPSNAGETMPDETKPDETAPADETKPADDAAPADEKASDEKPE